MLESWELEKESELAQLRVGLGALGARALMLMPCAAGPSIDEIRHGRR